MSRELFRHLRRRRRRRRDFSTFFADTDVVQTTLNDGLVENPDDVFGVDDVVADVVDVERLRDVADDLVDVDVDSDAVVVDEDLREGRLEEDEGRGQEKDLLDRSHLGRLDLRTPE